LPEIGTGDHGLLHREIESRLDSIPLINPARPPCRSRSRVWSVEVLPALSRRIPFVGQNSLRGSLLVLNLRALAAVESRSLAGKRSSAVDVEGFNLPPESAGAREIP
jgi:hypothetical protein